MLYIKQSIPVVGWLYFSRVIFRLCLRFFIPGREIRCEIYGWYLKWTRKSDIIVTSRGLERNVREMKEDIWESKICPMEYLQLIWIYWIVCLIFRYFFCRLCWFDLNYSMGTVCWDSKKSLIIDLIMNQFSLTIMAIYNLQNVSIATKLKPSKIRSYRGTSKERQINKSSISGDEKRRNKEIKSTTHP